MSKDHRYLKVMVINKFQKNDFLTKQYQSSPQVYLSKSKVGRAVMRDEV